MKDLLPTNLTQYAYNKKNLTVIGGLSMMMMIAALSEPCRLSIQPSYFRLRKGLLPCMAETLASDRSKV